jgi:hypothetical protein
LFLFPAEDGVKGKDINGFTMIQAELQDALAKIQTMHFRNCF